MVYWVLKVLLSPLFFLLWRVRVEGRHHVPSHGPALLAANHRSFCDSFFLPLVVTRKVTYLAKAEYFETWRTAWFFRAAGQIPVQRGGGDASQRALDTAIEVLASGRLLGVYPEGTRSRDNSVHRGRTGAARLALELGVPVVPVAIVGTDVVQPIGRRLMRPFHPVTIRFGAPMWLEPIGAGRRDEGSPGSEHPGSEHPGSEHPGSEHRALREFTDRVMDEISRLAERPYVDEYVLSGSDPPS